jgi:hypothetical protein
MSLQSEVLWNVLLTLLYEWTQRQTTVYTMKELQEHLQATSLLIDFVDVNFPFTVVHCISPVGVSPEQCW